MWNSPGRLKTVVYFYHIVAELCYSLKSREREREKESVSTHTGDLRPNVPRLVTVLSVTIVYGLLDSIKKNVNNYETKLFSRESFLCPSTNLPLLSNTVWLTVFW